MEWLFAAYSISQRSFHDFSSPSHDRGHADPEPSLHTQKCYVLQVSLFARHFSKSPELLGPEQIRAYQIYLTNERKLATKSILLGIAALRFLYKAKLMDSSQHSSPRHAGHGFSAEWPGSKPRHRERENQSDVVGSPASFAG